MLKQPPIGSWLFRKMKFLQPCSLQTSKSKELLCPKKPSLHIHPSQNHDLSGSPIIVSVIPARMLNCDGSQYLLQSKRPAPVLRARPISRASSMLIEVCGLTRSLLTYCAY